MLTYHVGTYTARISRSKSPEVFPAATKVLLCNSVIVPSSRTLVGAAGGGAGISINVTVKTSPILMISGLSGVAALLGATAAPEPLLADVPPAEGVPVWAAGTGGKSANDSSDPV